MQVWLKQKEETIQQVEEQVMPEDEPGVFCRACAQYVASPDDRIMVNESVNHVFANPHGIVYEIGCFSKVAGCLPVSEPTTEFSWFPGYEWQIVLCKNCADHLGWRFSSSSFAFYGLIYEKLVII